MLTLRQFAKMANTSTATVSRTFSGSDNVLPDTRERILSLAKRCGFSPSRARPSSVYGGTHSVGVLLPTVDIRYFSDIAFGVQKNLGEQNYLSITTESRAFPDGDRTALKRLIEHSVDGLIIDICDESVKRDDFSRLANFKGPVIQIESHRTGFSTDVVSTDDLEGGRLAAKHLLELGHRRIAFCRYGEGHSTCESRFAGFKSTLDAYGVSFDPTLEAALPPDPEGHESFIENLKKILSPPEGIRPTAIFAPMDTLVPDIYEVAAELGLDIPDDLSVVGYSDFDLARFMEPKLTCIRQDGIAVGAEAVRLFFQRKDNPDAPLKSSVLPVDLIVRQSTANLATLPCKRKIKK
ncbi:MAG: LacI family DNA-binding transcriptional regulator [Victivallales bacterium]